MLRKTSIVAAASIGYVLGARAGRERYEQIVDVARTLRRDPRVKKAASQAQDFAVQQAPLVKDKMQETAGKAASAAKSAAGSAREKIPSSGSENGGSEQDTVSTDTARLVQDVVDRVSAYQDGAPQDTIGSELDRGFTEAGIHLSVAEVQKLAEAIGNANGDVDASGVLGWRGGTAHLH